MVEETEVYVWAAVDMEIFEVIHIEVSPGRSDLDTILFIKQVSKRCRGDPVVLVDGGPWYNWALHDLDHVSHAEKRGGTGYWTKSGSACRNTESGSSSAGSPTIAPVNQ
jgi:transposase-like protein